MKSKLIAQGAEAKIFLQENKIIKNRIPKSYRIQVLDEKLRKSRTKSEAKILEKASSLINVPKVLKTDKYDLEIEYIQGDKLSETLNSYPEKKQIQVMKLLGKSVAKLHENNIIHGDLTTSNVILSTKPTKENCSQNQHQLINKNLSPDKSMNKNEMQLYIIDFGLGFISQRPEDKACDLHLIKQALEAKHYQNHEKLFKAFLQGYKYKESKQILEQLKKVEARGRYKH